MGRTGTDWSDETNRSGLEHAALAQTQRVESPHSILVAVGCQNAGGMGCVYLTVIPGGRSAFIMRKVKRPSSESSGYSLVLLSVPQEYDAHYHIDSFGTNRVLNTH